MKVVISRVKEASVIVEEKVIGEIKNGLVVLVGFTIGDSITDIKYIVDKIINMRIFDDEAHVMNKSLTDINGEILSVSQFTLYADAAKGRRPSYDLALNRTQASDLYNVFNQELRRTNLKIETGIFGADMEVTLKNDGPVTIILESRV